MVGCVVLKVLVGVAGISTGYSAILEKRVLLEYLLMTGVDR